MSAQEAADIRERNDRRMSRVPGVTGWVLESDDSHMLVYSGDYQWITHYETIVASPRKVTGTATAVPAQ